jgi:hypothetical protein
VSHIADSARAAYHQQGDDHMVQIYSDAWYMYGIAVLSLRNSAHNIITPPAHFVGGIHHYTMLYPSYVCSAISMKPVVLVSPSIRPSYSRDPIKKFEVHG